MKTDEIIELDEDKEPSNNQPTEVKHDTISHTIEKISRSSLKRESHNHTKKRVRFSLSLRGLSNLASTIRVRLNSIPLVMRNFSF